MQSDAAYRTRAGPDPQGTRACCAALILMIDVDNSTDVAEYRLRTDDMADALVDPEPGEAPLQGQVDLSLVHWLGVNKQALGEQVAAFAYLAPYFSAQVSIAATVRVSARPGSRAVCPSR